MKTSTKYIITFQIHTMNSKFYIFILLALQSSSCAAQDKTVAIPQPHSHFFGTWTARSITVHITSDSITVWDDSRHLKVTHLPNANTATLKTTKNSAREFHLLEERIKGFTSSHPFEYNPEDKTLKYGDRVLTKVE